MSYPKDICVRVENTYEEDYVYEVLGDLTGVAGVYSSLGQRIHARIREEPSRGETWIYCEDCGVEAKHAKTIEEANANAREAGFHPEHEILRNPEEWDGGWLCKKCLKEAVK